MEKNFNLFVSRLVHYHISNSSKHKNDQLSEFIGVSQSFFDKCLHGYDGKHFNLRHLFLIAIALETSVENLLPSIAGYSLLHNKELSQNEWDTLLKCYKQYNEE